VGVPDPALYPAVFFDTLIGNKAMIERVGTRHAPTEKDGHRLQAVRRARELKFIREPRG